MKINKTNNSNKRKWELSNHSVKHLFFILIASENRQE